jgi:Flp pilus assembly protein protease CpaA
MEEYILGWGTLALINAALANIDNRSPLAYLLGSIFFGPVLTIALAVTKYDPEKGTEFINIYHGRSNKPSPVTKLPNWLVAIVFFGFIALFCMELINRVF